MRITKPAATKVAVTKKVAVAKVGTAKKATAAKKALTPKKVAASKKATTPKKATAAKKVANTSAPVAGPIVAVADLAIVLKQLQATKCPPATEPKLKNWLKSILKRELAGPEFIALLDELKRTSHVQCHNRKLTYHWHKPAPEPNTCVTQELPSEFLF